MGGDTGLRHVIHLLGADLDLDGHPERSEQHGMQRLVTVGFGNGDVILEFSRHRFVQVMYRTDHAVTHIDVVHQDTERVDIVHLVE